MPRAVQRDKMLHVHEIGLILTREKSQQSVASQRSKKKIQVKFDKSTIFPGTNQASALLQQTQTTDNTFEQL